MKTAWLTFFLVLGCALAVGAQRGQPIPPGLREAESPERQIHFPPPAYSPRSGVTPQQLAREADELNRLAGEAQKQIEMVNQGQFPKDLPKNLKEIEKLAHKLSQQLTR